MLFKIVKCNMPVQADAVVLPADPRTRSHHSLKFKHTQSHTAQYKHSFFVRTVPEWNSLSEACVNADTVTAFQTQLHQQPRAVRTPHRRDTRKWSDDYRTRTRTRTRITSLTSAPVATNVFVNSDVSGGRWTRELVIPVI